MKFEHAEFQANFFCLLYREGNGNLSDIELMEQYHKDVADLQKRCA